MTTPNHDNSHGRRSRRNGGRTLLGLLLAGSGGFWLISNLPTDFALLSENPARLVLPALVILVGLAAIFTKRTTSKWD